MPKRTMVGGALPIELQVEIDCDLDDAALNEFLMNAVHASPLNGLMRGQLDSLFSLMKNDDALALGKASPIDGATYPDPGDQFAQAKPKADAAFDPLSWPHGTTPKKEVAVAQLPPAPRSLKSRIAHLTSVPFALCVRTA